MVESCFFRTKNIVPALGILILYDLDIIFKAALNNIITLAMCKIVYQMYYMLTLLNL